MGWRNGLGVGAALLAAVAFAPNVSVRADNISCDPQDLWNDLSNAWQDTATCAAACADGVGCAAAFLLIEAIATAKAGGDQSAVDTFCTDVQNAANDAATVVGDLRSIGVPDSVVQTVSSALNSVSSPLAAAQCACDEVSDLGSLIDDTASCIEAGVCLGTELFGGACGCTQPPTTVAANCSPNLANCGHWFYDEDCNDPKNYNDQLCQCERAGVVVTSSGTSPPIVKINTPGGTEVIQGDLSCGTSWSCFCPAPMTLQSVCDGAQDYTCPTGVNNINILYCACPDGTHPDPTGKFACLCNTSNQPANFTNFGHSFEPMCPPCPTGQVQWNGQCTPACAQSDLRTPDGACCNPNKVTYCGQCCPTGMTPDPVLGTCTPPPPPPQTQ
ncbi:MAG TPA: hypothetical protein VGJ20_32205 [Xanthobacteraceae bacterium]|jgi:hypothetical protein